ncbi:MAG: hypothetical protein ABIQ93_02520, partial [Saprospiraceae bacterium]
MSTVFRRIALGFLLVLALLFIAGLLFARFWLDGYLKDQLVTLTDRSSRQMYALQLDRLHVNIFTGSAELRGIHLQTDSLRWEELRHQEPESTPLRLDLKIGGIFIRHFDWTGFWRSKDFNLSSIEFLEPELKLASVKDSVLEKDPKTDTLTKAMLNRLPLMLGSRVKSLHVGSVEVYNGKMTYQTVHPRGNTYQQADSIDWILSGLNIVANDTTETGKALYADNILLTVRNYELWPPGSVYAYRFKSASFLGRDSLVKMEGVSVLPTLSDGEFMQRFNKIRRPRLRAKATEVVIRKLNLFRALHKNEWTMESLAIDGARINVYQNKNIPPRLNKKLPNEVFRTIPAYLNIDTILMRNANLLYTEVIEDGKGLLEFDKINGVILNVTNDTLRMSDSTPARIFARGELMGAGLLDVTLNLPLLARTFRCNYVANLGRMNMVYLNRLLTDKDHLRVDSGDSENIVARVRILGENAQGTVEATYSNLKLSLLREEGGKKKKFVSAVANLLIRGKNDRETEGRPFKVGTVKYNRDPTDGFIRFLWRSAQSGMMETLVPA